MLNPEFEVDDRLVSRLGKSTLLDPVADVIQPAIRSARDASPGIKSLLSGTWLGHSLHVILTDIPVGAFTALAALDVAELAGAADVSAGADVVLGFAILAGYGAALTGWSDWADTHEAPRRVGLSHAFLNGAALVAYQASFALRRSGRRAAGIATAFAGYAFIGLGAYLGGELSTGMHLGSRHTAEPLPPPDDFVDVASLADVVARGWLRVEPKGIPILLSAQSGEPISAVGAICTHRGGPLEEGEREDGCVRCPWHGAVFSLRDGRVREGPATFPLPHYETRVDGDRISVRARG